MRNFVVPFDDMDSIHRLHSWMPERLAERVRIDSYGSFLDRGKYDDELIVLGNFSLLGPAMQEEVRTVCDGIRSASSEVRIFNRPDAAKGRYAFLKTMREKGINDFDVFRPGEFMEAEARYPVFVREENRHTGAISELLWSRVEVERALAKIRRTIWYVRRPELLLVEFCETRSEDGMYRKYGAFRFGRTILAKELSFGDDWMVKFDPYEYLDAGTNTIRFDRLDEDQRFIDENPHENWIRSVFEVAGIEYGRLDYALKNGRLQAWEINTHPSYGSASSPPRTDLQKELSELRMGRRKEFNRRFFEAMLREIDAGSGGRSASVLAPSMMIGRRKREARLDAFQTSVVRLALRLTALARRVRARSRKFIGHWPFYREPDT